MDPVDDKLGIEARAANSLAMNMLTLAFADETLMSLITDSETEDYPNGLAWWMNSSPVSTSAPRMC